LKHSDKNAKIRDGSKNTTKDNLKCSSSNDSMMRTIPEESNASENNPNSKLTSAGSSSDHSSCDAKKVKIVKMQPVMILMIQALILTFKVKMPILALNMQVLMGIGNATFEEQDHDSYSKDSNANENGKKTPRK